MASIFLNVILLSLYFSVSYGSEVKWTISVSDKCIANDTVSGICARSRTVQCVKTLNGQIIPDYYCKGVSRKPTSFVECAAKNCPGRCVVSMWSSWQPCDVACARKFKFRTRSVQWRDNDLVTYPPLVEKSPCSQCAGNTNAFYLWMVGDWGTCRAFTTVPVYKLNANQSDVATSGTNLCGANLKIGKVTRKVKCIDTNGVEQKARKCLNSKDKDGRITQRPDRSKVCQFACDCHVSAWTAWSGCPVDCSRMVESRTRGILYPPQFGGKACGSLVETRPCNTKCPSYTWYSSSWGECRNEDVNTTYCGDGFKERVVFCVESNSGNYVQPVGYHLCDMKIKPVARQLCQTPCPRDCVVSSWNAWEPCSISCGGAGVKRRVRSVVQKPKNGGADCPSLVQMAQCEMIPCASWFALMWSPCIAAARCGGAMRHRLVYCRAVAGTWTSTDSCSWQPTPPVTMNCTVPCPNDCVVSDWGEWGSCSKSCGEQGGVQVRKRSILAYPSPVRTPCPSADKLIETQKCNVGKLCGTTYMWRTTSWGPCERNVTGKCGAARGIQRRDVNCGNDMTIFMNDTQCENMTKPAKTKQCDLPCPRDCVLSLWGNWSTCNATCGTPGIQISKRYIIQNAEYDGIPCSNGMTSGMEVRTRLCWTNQPCFNYTWSVTPWKDCQILPQLKLTPATCGAGYQIRNISCMRSDGKLMETSYCYESSLDLQPKTLKECWKPCDDYCVRSSWSEWTKCPNRCTHTAAVRSRRRQVVNLSPARGGFSATCPRLTALDLTETENCPKITCKSYNWYAAPFASCIPRNSVTNCGEGSKERHVLCQDQSDLSFVAESYCDQAKKPSSSGNCLVQCNQDCVVSLWGKWDKLCSNTCGNTMKTRQRTVLKQPLGFGRACPSLIDKQLCHEPACISFKWKVGIWNTCKLSSKASVCGNGTQTREVVCSPDLAREWICAKQAPKPAIVQECFLPCPGDCVVSNWSPWSTCVKGKDGCVRNRWRNKKRQEHATSVKVCSGYAVEEKVNCTCPSAGKIVTSDWTTCMLNEILGPRCGKGMQYRSVKCEGENGTVLDKKECSNFDATLSMRSCEIPCPVDCVMGHWSEWSRCTAACGLDGKIQRSRKVLRAEQNGGRKCPEETQFRPCNSMPCYTYNLSRGAWGKCYVNGRGCGPGSESRETMCRRSDGEIVSLHFCFGQLKKSSDDATKLKVLQDVINNSSQLTLTSSRDCEISCPGDCYMSKWSDWSECGKNCFGNGTKYSQTRTRVVISSPDAGGKACSSDLLQTRECKSVGSLCIGAQWRTGAWQVNGTRAVWCETSSGVKVTGACAARNKPSATKSCSPTCSDSNSVCHEGKCICKPNYELFQGQCIPTQGCLQDGHCIEEHTECDDNLKCACKVNYIWNTTSGICVPMQKILTDQPTMVSTTDKTMSMTAIPEITRTEEVISTKVTSTKVTSTKVTSTKVTTVTLTEENRVSTTEGGEIASTTVEVIAIRSTTENSVKQRLQKDESIPQEFWKWIGIGGGALVFFLVLAIGFYCYTKRQRKAKHKMMKLKRNTIELVGVMTYTDGPEKV